MDIEVGEAGWRNGAWQEDKKGHLFVYFFSKPVKHNFKSQQEKRPVFESRTFIHKEVPGDARLVIERPVRDTDAEEFPVEWARYEQKKEAVMTGTLLEAWSGATDTQVAEFKALKIYTVEQLANLPDSNAQQIMGFHDMRTKARNFVMANKGNEVLEGVKEQLAKRDEEIAELRQMIEAQGQATPKRRGRKPKAEQEQVAA